MNLDDALHGGAVSKVNETEQKDSPAASFIDEIEPVPVRPYYGAIEPRFELQKENARHRAVLDMRIACPWMTLKEIAREFGYTEVLVSNLIRQQWAQEYLASQQNLSATSLQVRVTERLEKIAMKAADRLEQLVDLPLEPEFEDGKQVAIGHAETVRKSINDTLNRLWGTPKQTVDVTHKEDLSTKSDAEIAEMLARQSKRS